MSSPSVMNILGKKGTIPLIVARLQDGKSRRFFLGVSLPNRRTRDWTKGWFRRIGPCLRGITCTMPLILRPSWQKTGGGSNKFKPHHPPYCLSLCRFFVPKDFCRAEWRAAEVYSGWCPPSSGQEPHPVQELHKMIGDRAKYVYYYCTRLLMRSRAERFSNSIFVGGVNIIRALAHVSFGAWEHVP